MPFHMFSRWRQLLALLLVGLNTACVIAADITPSKIPADDHGKLAAFEPRPGRPRPVIAVVADNGGTELTDFVIPYGILKEGGVADVLALSTNPGAVRMRPTSLRMLAHATVTEFDQRYPDGADYVVVPAVVRRDAQDLQDWITGQGHKGARIVSICDGALVVARTGLMKGRRGTAHWYTHDMRMAEFPDTTWLKNTRYVADGPVVSSAGISAAMPTALALLEAIGGHDRAAAVAARHGIDDWSTRHNSDQFVPRFGVNLLGHATVHYTNGWFHRIEAVGVPVQTGVDDIALAVTMDAYSRTGRSRALAVARGSEPFTTRLGLTFLPDRSTGDADVPQRLLPALPQGPMPAAFDRVLDAISTDYGANTADGVAYDFEYVRHVQ